MQGAWDPEILVSVSMDVGVPVEDDLSDIGMHSKRAVICLERGFEEDWLRSFGEWW